MEVRAADVDDARAIATVHVEAWRWAYAGLIANEVLDVLDVEERARGWTHRLEHPDDASEVLVAELDEVVAFCSYAPARDVDAGDDAAELLTLYRLERAGHLGVGRELLTRAMRGMKERAYLLTTAWVLDGNEWGQRFYERNGWAPDGAGRGYEIAGRTYPTSRFRREL